VFGGFAEIRRYLENVSRYYGLKEHIRFNQKVEACAWDDVAQMWTVTTHDGEKHVANFVVSACGILHVPRKAQFEGNDQDK
jgi:cation diffusion facilitator CzcD-associated flavoprotein CzcO